MLQTTSLPVPNNILPASRWTKRRHQVRKCYRCSQRGHRAAECEAPFPRQKVHSQHTSYTTPKIIKKEPDSLQEAFPQHIPKATTTQEYQDYRHSIW